MKEEEGLAPELVRAGVAAETIRKALGPYREKEMLRIIAALAKAPATMEALLEIKADATSFYKLTKELETVINRGKE